MAAEFRFPDVGEGIHEGRVVEWLVSEGTPVAADQPLVKVETDKAIVDLPSPHAGVVTKRHAAEGDTIHVGDVLVTFDGGPAPTSPAPTAAASAPPEVSTPAPAVPTAPDAKSNTPATWVGVSTLIRCPKFGWLVTRRSGKVMRADPVTRLTGPRRLTSAVR